MDKLLISGPCKIKGQVSISASKNAALPILASTLLFDKPVVIQNLPKVRDIDTMLNLLKSLGKNLLLTFKVILAIHYEALKLFFKGMSFKKKPQAPKLQICYIETTEGT